MHGAVVWRHRARCVATMDDICDFRKRDKRYLRTNTLLSNLYAQVLENAETINAKYIHTEERDLIWVAEDKLSLLSRSEWEATLERARFRMQGMLPDLYILFISGQQQKLPVGISWMLNETVVVCVSPDTSRPSWYTRETDGSHPNRWKGLYVESAKPIL